MKKLIAITLIALAGCSKLTMENYNQLKVGMSYQQVSQIIGEADSCDEVMGTRSCVWGQEQPMVKAAFLADKAVAFSHKGLK